MESLRINIRTHYQIIFCGIQGVGHGATTVIFSHVELVLSVGLNSVNENLFKLLESLMGNILMTERLFCYYESN